MLLSYKFKILSYIWINLYGIGVDYRVCSYLVQTRDQKNA